MTSINAARVAGLRFLGIEGGGTRTVAIMADGQGKLVRRIEAGPGNLRLLDDTQLLELLEGIAAAFPRPDAVGIGMAGARTAGDWKRIGDAAGRVWSGVPRKATNDLETALAAGGKAGVEKVAARVLVLSGTGSCCFGRVTGKSALLSRGTATTAKVGGWGHILGDGGSGYDIGLGTLRGLVTIWDETGTWPALGNRILRRLKLKEPHALIGWVQSADKAQVAALAEEVFRAAERGDVMAKLRLDFAATSLARDAMSCARKLTAHGKPVEFVLAGGILLKQPKFAAQVSAQLKESWPDAVVTRLEREGAWGAVALAREIWESQPRNKKRAGISEAKFARKNIKHPVSARLNEETWAKQALTEQRNPRSINLDKLPLEQAVELMLSEDARVPAAIRKWRKEIAQAVKLVASAFRSGGRLFYVGAGTSGRLGVLDASECPPTFRSPPEMVQGIMAGGPPALMRSVEGAEDDAELGARSIAARRVNRQDVVVGISASGRTPFVWGALAAAKKRGAKTILLCFNPFQKQAHRTQPTLVIAPEVGPEVLTGSTRLKAGTATKLILNMLTTLAMAQTGRVAGNLMVDLNPSNVKLRGRAVRIVRELCGVDEPAARGALERSGWVVSRACAKLGRV